MLTMFKISLAANELYSNLDSYDLAKSSRCGSSVPSLNKHSSLVLRSLKTNILSGAQAKPQMQVIFRHRLSFKTWRLTFMQDRNFFSCWKSTLSENGDQSCFGNKEIRGTFETGCAAYASNRRGAMDQQSSRKADGWSSGAQWDAGGAAGLPRGPLCPSSVSQCVSPPPRHVNRPPPRLYAPIHSPRFHQRRERQKSGDGRVAALVERGGDWCLEDLSFYSFCSDPPFWAAANPSFASHGWEERGKARRQLLEKWGR